jgi:putative ABC transport system permease protein
VAENYLTPALVGLLIVLAALALLAARRPVLFRIGARNFVRHKSTSALVVAGLLIGTAILAGAAVMGDSVQHSIIHETYERLDLVDVEASRGDDAPFNRTVADALRASPALLARADAIAPELFTFAGVMDNTSKQIEPQVAVRGIDPLEDAGFGEFVRVRDGSRTSGEELNRTNAFLDDAAAKALDAHEGDELRVVLVHPSYPFPLVETLKLDSIVSSEGKGGYGSTPNLFVRLGTLQQALRLGDVVSSVKLSAPGDRVAGVVGSAALAAEARTVLDSLGPEGWSIRVREVKQNGLEDAREASSGIRTFMSVLGSFSIIAGVFLIVNIFTMLAEERKVELGMGRAMGMRRRSLVLLFLFEGLTYAVVAAAAGVLGGMAIGLILVSSINVIFATEGSELTFTVVPSSMADSFALGLLVTLGTITIASYRLSKLNIVRAVRDLPEPETDATSRRLAVVGGAVAGLLGLLFIVLRSEPIPHLLLPGIALIASGAPLARFVKPRIAHSAASLGGLLWVLYNLAQLGAIEGDPFPIFVGSGLISVFAGTIIILVNSDSVVAGLAALLRRGRRLRPAAKISTAYPLHRRFRTGSTVAMFALVLYTLTVLTVFSGIFLTDVDDVLKREAGGYEVMGNTFSPTTLNASLSSALRERVSSYDEVAFMRPEIRLDGELVSRGSAPGAATAFDSGTPLMGVDDRFMKAAYFPLGETLGGIPAQQAWASLADGDKVIVDAAFGGGFAGPFPQGAKAGSVVSVKGTNGTRDFTIVGVTQTNLVRGAAVSRQAMREMFTDPIEREYASKSMMFLFRPVAGAELDRLALDLERDFSGSVMNAINLRKAVEQSLAGFSRFMLLFQGFLGLGLVVGIAGLGVVTARNIVERRQEIGVMRALGFRRKLVLSALLIEVLVVVSLGALIGTGVGLSFAYQLFQVAAPESVEFKVDLVRLGTMLLIAYTSAVLCTLAPAIRAARMRPSEALRYVG